MGGATACATGPFEITIAEGQIGLANGMGAMSSDECAPESATGARNPPFEPAVMDHDCSSGTFHTLSNSPGIDRRQLLACAAVSVPALWEWVPSRLRVGVNRGIPGA